MCQSQYFLETKINELSHEGTPIIKGWTKCGKGLWEYFTAFKPTIRNIWLYVAVTGMT